MSPVLCATALSRSFGEENAVDGVDFEVEAGEIHALVGLNGAGKTTLMRLLLGMIRPDSGQATVMGRAATTAGPEVWARVGHLIETPFSYRELTVTENVRAAALLNGMDSRSAASSTQRVVEAFELTQWSHRRAATLSLGNRQRLGLAGAVVHQPSVLVLDEPANALDPAGVVFTRDLIQDFASRGAAVLVSSHHFDQLARVADRISVLHHGKLIGSLDPTGTDLEVQFFDLVHSWDLAGSTR